MGFLGNDKASARVVTRVQAPRQANRQRQLMGVGGCVFLGTEAVSSACFANPIERQPAGAHVIFR